MSKPEVYTPERLAAIRAALDAFPDRRGALRKILFAIADAGARDETPMSVLDDIMRILFLAQTHVVAIPPPNPQAAHEPFLTVFARLFYEAPDDAPTDAAAAAARLIAVADVAVALFRFKGKAYE